MNSHKQLLVYPGMPAAEIKCVLAAAFGLTDVVAGLRDPDQDVHFPLSLVSKAPAFFADRPSLGLSLANQSSHLQPTMSSHSLPSNPAQSIDSDIVQRHIFAAVLGIDDPRGEALTFVGGNRDAGYLRAEVDAGRHDLAVTLAPVTIDQFIDVCRQYRMMPPKSTWFQPKIRSGLVMALLA